MICGLQMDKITEEVITSLIKRVEALEAGSKPIKRTFSSGEASQAQMKYLQSLGGEIWAEMTKAEAGEAIDRLLLKKKKHEAEQAGGAVYEPSEVDTDDAGLDGEDLM